MKRYLTTITAMLLSVTFSWAGDVTQEQALINAQRFLNKSTQMSKVRKLQAGQTLQISKSEQERYYAFNIGDNSGFILVSRDDRTPAILGYAESGTFDSRSMPDNLRWWLEEYEHQLKQLDQYDAVDESQKIRIPIAPMLSSQWDQGEPYWNDCPSDPRTGNKCYSGCVATAMAQILNFHKFPQQTVATIPAYTTVTRGISIASIAPTAIDWDNMLDEYDANTTSQNENAVANLMYLCGTSVEMDYSSSGSGSNCTYAALAIKNIFGYDDNMKMLYRDEYSASEWNDIVYAELAANRPVFYAGKTVSSGHAFVIDGYSENDFFHVNWGWGGSCDGYFLLSILNPYSNEGIGASVSTDGYSTNQQIITGIQPPTDLPVENDRLTSSGFYVDQDLIDTEWKRETTGGFSVPFFYAYRNNSLSSIQFEYGLGIFDADNQLVEVQVIADSLFGPLGSCGYTTFSTSLAKGLPNGSYDIKGISRRSGSTQWLENTCSDMWQVLADVSDSVLTLTRPFYHYDATLNVLTEKPIVGEPLTIQAHLKNYGMQQHETLYLMVNGSYVAGRQFEVGANDSVDIDFVFLPTLSGTNTVKLVRPNGSYSYKTYASKTISVSKRTDIELLSGINISKMNNKGVINSTTADITVTITNNSVQNFNNDVKGVLYTYDSRGYLSNITTYNSNFSIASGASTEWNLSIDGLEAGTSYSFVFAYYNSSSWKYNWNGETYFSVEEVVEIEEDMTYLLENPSFEAGSYGWTVDAEWGGNVAVGGSYTNYCFEAWNNARFDIYQEIYDLPKGVYEIQVQGFYRYLRDDNAWNAYQKANGKIDVPTYVYLNNSSTPFKNVFDEPVPAGTLYSGDYYITPDRQYTFPNDMATSAEAFYFDMYRQSAYGIVSEDGGMIRIGVKGSSNQGADSWVIWDNFKLIYRGFHANSIEPVLGKAIADAKDALIKSCGKTQYNNLITSIEKAEEAYYGNDGELMFYELERLYDTQQELQQSAELFLDITESLEELKWDFSNFNVADEETQNRVKWFYEITLANTQNHNYEDADIPFILEQIAEMRGLVRMPANMNLATANNPIDCTSLLLNPSFEKDGNNTVAGWYGWGICNCGNNAFQMSALAIEFYQSEFDWHQQLQGIPNGYYKLTVRGFYRYGTYTNDYHTFTSGHVPENAYIYMDNGKKMEQKTLQMLSNGASASRQGQGEEVQISNGWVPDDMVSSVNYFRLDKYLNECIINVDNNDLTIGAAKTGIIAYDWVMLDDFRLYYFGSDNPSAIESHQIAGTDSEPEYFDLLGRKASPDKQGLEIIRIKQNDKEPVTHKIIMK